MAELRSCVKVEVAVLGPLTVSAGRKATLSPGLVTVKAMDLYRSMAKVT